VESLFPVKTRIRRYLINAILYMIISVLYITSCRCAIAVYMADAEEKGVIHFPQVVVICSRIPRPADKTSSYQGAHVKKTENMNKHIVWYMWYTWILLNPSTPLMCNNRTLEL
jgi:hypothetical protein